MTAGTTPHLRYQNLLATGVQLKVEEDTTYDNETLHTTEAVAFLAIAGEGLLTAAFSLSPPTIIAFEQNGPAGLSNTLETLSYTFDKEVVVTAGDLTLKDLTGGGAAVRFGPASGFHYDSATRQATWDFTSAPAISTGSYEVVLSAATIVDVTGNPLGRQTQMALEVTITCTPFCSIFPAIIPATAPSTRPTTPTGVIRSETVYRPSVAPTAAETA